MKHAHAVAAGIALALLGPSVYAGVIEVDAFHTGGFYGLDDMGMPSATPDNDLTFQNYFMGRTTVSGFTTPERRSFFAFDMDSVIPVDEEIVSMSLVLENVFGGVLANFTGDSEVALFTSTSSGYAEIADPMGAMLPPEMIFDTFGTGDFYGDIVFDADGPMPGAVEIVLSPDAIADAMLAGMAGSEFVITGRMATYDPDPAALFEFVFGLTDVVVGGLPTGFPAPKLVIETAVIPAPASPLALAGLGLWASRRRR